MGLNFSRILAVANFANINSYEKFCPVGYTYHLEAVSFYHTEHKHPLTGLSVLHRCLWLAPRLLTVWAQGDDSTMFSGNSRMTAWSDHLEIITSNPIIGSYTWHIELLHLPDRIKCWLYLKFFCHLFRNKWVHHYIVLFLYTGGMQKYNYWSSQWVRDHRFPNMFYSILWQCR